jgi:hypothetical protein
MLDPEVCDKCWAEYRLGVEMPPCFPAWFCRRPWEHWSQEDISLEPESNPPDKCPKAFEHAVSLGRRGEK